MGILEAIYIMLVPDEAGWLLQLRNNITFLHLPVYSLELNPID
jgi:hypothetical protein